MSAPGAAMSAVIDPTVRQRLRRNRAVLLVLGLLVATAVLLAWAGSGTRVGYLDPEAADPAGARAVVEVLREQGVEVTVVRRAQDVGPALTPVTAGDTTSGTTLVVAGPAPVSEPVAVALAAGGAGAAEVVLVDPTLAAATTLAPQARGGQTLTTPGPVAPGCQDPVASRAGPLELSGTTFATGEDAVDEAACYRPTGIAEDPGATAAGYLLRLPAGDGRPATSLWGDGTVLTNARLADGGNAALGLGLLGGRRSLVWYVPTLADPLVSAGPVASPTDLLPGWVPFVVLQLLVAGLLLAFARGRRLGAVVTEPLPVVVRAAESVQGRARLYRRGRARGHAAGVLRARSTRSLAGALGLPRAAEPGAVVVAVSARTRRPASQVADLLTGPDPADDAALVRLADDLDALNREVRRP